MSDKWILWAIVIAYMVFIFFKGVSKARKIGDTDDFLVAGRNIGWFLLFCTMGATVIGGGASIGAIGRTYEWGVLMLLVSTGWYLHFIFSGLVVAPQFRKANLYTVAGYFGHRFGEGPRFLMLILSLMFSVFIVAAQMAAFGSVLATIMPEFADVSSVLTWAILIGGAMVVIYSTAGGLLAVIHTDVYQFLILMVGFAVTLTFCIPDVVGSYNSDTHKFVPTRFGAIDLQDAKGFASKLRAGDDGVSSYLRSRLSPETLRRLDQYKGRRMPSTELQRGIIDDLNQIVTGGVGIYCAAPFEETKLTSQTKDLIAANPEGRDLSRLNLSLIQDSYPDEITRNRRIPGWFFLPQGNRGWLFLLTTFFAFLLGETFAPGYATRYCVGRDIKETRRGIAGVGIFLALTFPAVLFFIALYARIHFPDIESQQALPMVVMQLHSPWIGGLIIGALMMAVMSSADSALNSSTAIFVKDLFEHQLGWRDRGDGRMLKLARICTAVLGCTAIAIAIIWPDIIGLLMFTYHVWAPAVILPICIGTLTKKRSRILTRNIFITMIAATSLTLSYRGILFLYAREWWAPFGENTYAILESFDPSVFGVMASCAVFFSLTLLSSVRSKIESIYPR
ncbi:MAG: sodium:solute symporter family protein [Acidobacteria bacterium]|nr:sodium:solute symporter family protein [Acidobacteriota bacterium]